MRLAVLGAALWLLSCHRGALRFAPSDDEAFAGVPVSFGDGNAMLTWDFGDGSPFVNGRLVSHAFAHKGDYVVRALEGSRELWRTQLEVAPRPPEHAIPKNAETALFVRRTLGNMELLVDFLERLFGESTTTNLLDRSPALGMALERTVRGSSELDGIDPEEGVGGFTLAGFSGVVELVGVVDGKRAMLRVVERLDERGAVLRREGDESISAILDGKREVSAFVDRGYLYLIQRMLAASDDLPAIRKMIREDGGGLWKAPGFREQLARVHPGIVSLYSRQVANREGAGSAVASLRLADDALLLDGLVNVATPLWKVDEAPPQRLLAEVPRSAMVVSVSLGPADAVNAAFGKPTSPTRSAAEQTLARYGLSTQTLFEILRGDAILLAWVDISGFVDELARRASPLAHQHIAWVVELGLASREKASALLERMVTLGVLRSKGTGKLPSYVVPSRLGDGTLDLLADRIRIDFGGAQRKRAPALVSASPQGFEQGPSAGAFGPGHISLRLGLADLPGASMVQALANAALEPLRRVDHFILDAVPDQGMLRIRGALTLRPAAKR